MLRMAQNQQRNKIIRCTSPLSFLKKPQLNCTTNTGHINKLKHSPERHNSQLCNSPKNAKNQQRSNIIALLHSYALQTQNSIARQELESQRSKKISLFQNTQKWPREFLFFQCYPKGYQGDSGNLIISKVIQGNPEIQSFFSKIGIT